MNDIIETTLTALDVLESGMASPDQYLSAMEFVKRLGEVHRELKDRMEQATIKYIQAHGPIEDGTKRYYVAANKSTKCVDVRRTVEALLNAVGGDVDAFTDCLSSGAFKPAATKKVLGEAGADLFVTTETPDLKTGEIKPRLQCADERFQ